MKFFILLIVSLFIATPSFAQTGEDQVFIAPGSNYENNAVRVRQILKQNSLSKAEKIEPNTINISFVHYGYMEPRQFGIMMNVPNVVTGCYKFSPLEYKASFVDNNYMDIKVDSYRREVVKADNVNADCSTKNQSVSALVVVNSDDLQKRNIQEIRFSNGKAIDRYKIKIDSQSITFLPDSMIVFKPTNLSGKDQDRVVHHFKGAETIIALHVPMAEKNDDIANAVRKLAYQSSLIPIFETDGLNTSGDRHVFYFKDPNHALLEGLNAGGYMELGEIPIKRPYLGENGLSGTTKRLKVFATKPETRL